MQNQETRICTITVPKEEGYKSMLSAGFFLTDILNGIESIRYKCITQNSPTITIAHQMKLLNNKMISDQGLCEDDLYIDFEIDPPISSIEIYDE